MASNGIHYKPPGLVNMQSIFVVVQAWAKADRTCDKTAHNVQEHKAIERCIYLPNPSGPRHRSPRLVYDATEFSGAVRIGQIKRRREYRRADRRSQYPPRYIYPPVHERIENDWSPSHG